MASVFMAVLDPEDWPLRAKCRGMNDALFPEGKDQKRAKSICMGCPVRAQCLAEADLIDKNPNIEIYEIMNSLFKKTIREGYIFKVSHIVKCAAALLDKR